MTAAFLYEQYLEAVRMYMWYSPNPYSYHKGKSSKDRAATYYAMAQKFHADRAKLLRGDL